MKETLLKEKEAVEQSMKDRYMAIGDHELQITIQKSLLKQDKNRLKLIEKLIESGPSESSAQTLAEISNGVEVMDPNDERWTTLRYSHLKDKASRLPNHRLIFLSIAISISSLLALIVWAFNNRNGL